MDAAEKNHRLLSPSPCLSLPDTHKRARATNGKAWYRILRIPSLKADALYKFHITQ